METETKFLIFFSISFFLLGFLLSELLHERSKSFEEFRNSITEENITEKCKNLTLRESAYCLRDETEKFYKYKITDDSIDLSFEELKELGGDCRSYSFYYEELAKRLGFNSTTRAYGGKKDIFPGHRMAFMWDNETYCKLDLLDVSCSVRMDMRE